MLNQPNFDPSMSENKDIALIEYATEIVAAYVSNNSLNREDLNEFISETYSTLRALYKSSAIPGTRRDPAVSIENSITDDYIICLEDGKRLKMLKRHLKSAYGMSPEEYRERWGLPADYPMVAPNYAKRRSSLAKDIGLGTRRRKKVIAEAA